MKDKNPKRFYDLVDRDKEYSICKNAEEHSFYPMLKKAIEIGRAHV